MHVVEKPSQHILKPTDIPYSHYPKPVSFSRDECARNPVQYFVILSNQRSGSGWFETLWNSHANVSSNGEIFSVYDRRKNISSIVQTLDKVYNLDWLSSASKNECSAAVGLKWMLNQRVSAMPTTADVCNFGCETSPDRFSGTVSEVLIFKGLTLNGHDLLEMHFLMLLGQTQICKQSPMVSMLANSYDRYAKLLDGTHKSHVHSAEEADTLAKYKPTLNSSSLLADLEEMETKTAMALGYFNSTRHMVLYYEDLMSNRTKLQDALEFLGLPQMDLRSRQVKIHRGPMAEHIKNWDDVKRTLNGTIYESVFGA